MTRLFHAAAMLAAIAFAIGGYVYLTLPDVRVLRTENPTTTAFMELRDREARVSGKPQRREHRWLALGRNSANLKRAVLVADDAAFWQHEGVDLEQSLCVCPLEVADRDDGHGALRLNGLVGHWDGFRRVAWRRPARAGLPARPARCWPARS